MAENKVKLTKRLVDSFVPDKTKRIFVWDTEITGFCLRVYPTGRKVYYLQYRNQDGVTHKVNIGPHNNITTEKARERAAQLSLEIRTGVDPSEEVKQSKSKPSMIDLANEYIELHAKVNKRTKSSQEDERMISTFILPKLGNMKVECITSNDLQKLHKDLQQKPYAANRVRALLNKMFNLAIQWRWITANPTLGVGKYEEHKRDRWLDDDEMARLWEVLDRHAFHQTSYVFKLLLLTGARRGEVLNATWDQFDLAKGNWKKPSHLTKQKKKDQIPLSSNTIEVLQELRHRFPSDNPFLFPGKVEGQPMKEVKTFWSRVLKEAGINDFRIHDLRHTHASHLVSRGMSLPIVGKLLGHTQASTTHRYAHLADAPLREAAELFGNMVGKKKSSG